MLAAAFWLALWQIIAMLISNSTFLPAPFGKNSVTAAIAKLIVTGNFWLSLGNTFYRIALSFVLAAALAIGLAVLSYKFNIVKILLSPLISFLKAAPVVSFTMILFIAFFSNRAFIAPVTGLMMVLPVLYAGVLAGLENTDIKLKEMAKVFNVSAKNRALYIYGSNVMPFFVSACKSGLGLCWKAAVAAEVIGSVKNTVGGNMLTVQTFFRTSELLAWTAVIIALSVGFEKLFLFALKKIQKRIET